MKSLPKSTHGTAGTILRHARNSANLSLRGLAQRAGTSHATIAAYESSSKSPGIDTLMRILEAAGFAVDISLSRRIRERDGLPRGEELRQTLILAAQFPAELAAEIQYPRIDKLRGSA